MTSQQTTIHHSFLHSLAFILMGFFTVYSPSSFSNPAQQTEMYFIQSLGFPVHRDAVPVNHIMVKRTLINGNMRITIHPFDKPDKPWLEFAKSPLVNQTIDSKNQYYDLIAGSFMAVHPTQENQAITVQHNSMLTRLAERPDGTFIIYMGDPSHVNESKAARYMKTPYFVNFALQESDIPTYETVKVQDLFTEPKEQERVLKAHFDKVNSQDMANLKIPAKGALHQGSVAKQSIKLAKRIAEQDGQTAGKTHVVSNGWQIRKHGITGVPLYRYANVAFTQKNKNGKCMLLGFQIRQDYGNREYSDLVYSKTMLRNPPYNQYMSCQNF